MKTYRHFKTEDREKLFALKTSGKTQSQIAAIMGMGQGSISRELKRNRDVKTNLYVPELAQQKASGRKRRMSKIDRHLALKTYIRGKLEEYWSPEAIAGRLKLTTDLPTISSESIYQWLYRGPQKKEKLYQFLARRKRKRGLRKDYIPRLPKNAAKVSIHERPEIINNRERKGDWEGDLIIGKCSQSQALTLSERVSKYVFIKKLKTKTLEETSAMIERTFKESGVPVWSTTLDNGTEFNDFNRLKSALGIDIYFCDPHAPWQKGGIENVNGIIRRTIPKRTSLDEYTQQDLDDLAWTINNTPRKILAFRTPYEVLFQQNHPFQQLCTCN